MRATRIVFALALAGLVVPAFAGGVGNDTLISGFGNDFMQPPDAPGGFAAAPSANAGSRTHRPIEFTTRLDRTIPLDAPGGLAEAPSVAEMAATKSTDLAGPSLMLMLSSSQGRSLDRGSGNDTLKSAFGNDAMPRGDRIGAAALPQPAAGSARQGQALVFYLGGMPAPRTALTGAASGRPAESLSFNYSKIDYKYIPPAAKGPAVGAMAVRR
jgi:type VI protein secretion system component Hcp